MKTFIDLFCGIGGFRLALEKQGLKCVFSSDIDRHVQDVYFKNFKEKPHGDLCKIDEKKIPKHDILCAGFPCQSFSISGRQKGFDDERGQLFFEIIRIAKYHKPKVLLLENVRNILSVSGGDIIKTIVNELEKIGYDVNFNLLDASDFGIAQARKRVYFVCLRKNSNLKYTPPTPIKKQLLIEDILIAEEKCKNLILKRTDLKIDKTKKQKGYKTILIGTFGAGSQTQKIYSIKGVSPTLTCGYSPYIVVKNYVRRLHIDEKKKLMGFPVRHKVSDSIVEGYKQLGNGVIPKMIEKVYDGISKN